MDLRCGLTQHSINRERGGAQLHEVPSAAPREEEEEGMGLYSTVPPLPATRPSQPHSQVETESKKATTIPRATDLLYEEVDKGAVATIRPSKAEPAVDQLYAYVDKKKSNGAEATLHPDTAVDQLYAEVDKKTVKEASKDSPVELYSVVNKPRAPQLPPKSFLLMEDKFKAPQLPPKSDQLIEELNN